MIDHVKVGVSDLEAAKEFYAKALAPLGYHCVVFDRDPQAGGMMRTQIPKFRLPDSVIDEETGYVLNLGVDFRAGKHASECGGIADVALQRRGLFSWNEWAQTLGEQIAGAELVAVTSAAQPDNPEWQAALAAGVPVWKLLGGARERVAAEIPKVVARGTPKSFGC